MTKISDLPSIRLDGSLYYNDSFILAANGYDESGDYVTGQISGEDMFETYISEKVATAAIPYQSIDSSTVLLIKEPYMNDVIAGVEVSELVSYVCNDSYFDDSVEDIISSYVNNGYIDDYLSNYTYTYLSNYCDNMSVRSYTSEISGIVVKYYDELAYVSGSNFKAMIRSCVFYHEHYPGYLSDDTELAGMYLSTPMAGVDGYLAPITLGDIVSYIKSRI